MSPQAPQTPYERFKWEILDMAVFEDYQGLWEPLYWLRGSGQVAGQGEPERQEWAARALLELHRDGLIYLFQVPAQTDTNAAGADPRFRLSSDEVLEAISSDWWRGRAGLPDDASRIWFGPTPKAEAERGLPDS